MTRILAFADLHIGAGTSFGTAPYGPGSRLADQEQVLERIVDVAIEEKIDLALFAGDLWHRPRPTPWEIATAQRPLERLADVCPVIAINGNTHDMVNPELPMALDVIFGERFRVSTTPEVLRWPARFIPQQVWIATLPWTPTSRLVASRNGGDRDRIHHDAASMLIDVARGLREQCPDDRPAILLAHWSVSGAVTPTGVATDVFREPVLPLKDLEYLGFDAVILGHIHKRQELTLDPILYCGSPAVVNFGEADCDHGVWILETDTEGIVEWKFVPIDDRRFVMVDFDLTLAGDREALEVIQDGGFRQPHALDDAVVRVRYTAAADQAKRIDHAAITRALLDAGAHRVYAIQPEIVREDRARVEGLDESLPPLEALHAYVTAQQIDTKLADLMGARTATYLERLVA